MADVYIHSLTDLWNDGGTTYHAIKMDVTNAASAAGSRLITLQVGGTDKFYVDKNGNVVAVGSLTSTGALLPSANDGAALGASGAAWSDLFLASGAVVNFNAGDVTLTHAANLLAFAGAASGYTFDGKLVVGHTTNLSVGGNADNAEIFGTDAATGGLALGMFSATAGTQAHLDFYRSKNAAIGSATVVASGDGLGSINWFGAQQTGTFATQNPAAQIRAEVDGTVTSGASADMPGRIVFATTADAAGTVTDRIILDAGGTLKPSVNDGVALGTAALSFSDLFLASGGVINFANGDVTLTHSSNVLAHAGASSGYTFDAAVLPSGNDAAALGSATVSWSDLFLASGAVLNFANGDAAITHSTGVITVGTGDLRVTSAGSNAASVVTRTGTQTITGKTIDFGSNTLTGTKAQFNAAVSNDTGFAYLNTANAFTVAQSISVTGTGTAFSLTSTDAGAASGPNLLLNRDSASPAASDFLGGVVWQGRDDGAALQNYGGIFGQIVSPVAGAESSSIVFQTPVGGAIASRVTIGGGVQIGNAPTGGDLGPGTLNAQTSISIANVLVPTISSTSTFTNKSVDLNTNTVTGTKALFNVALSDDNFAFVGTANAFTAAQTITISSTMGEALRLAGDNNNGALGVDLAFYRSSTSPTFNDDIGSILAIGKNSAAADKTYASVLFEIDNDPAGSENGRITFSNIVVGTFASRLIIGGAGGIYTPGATGTDKGTDSINAKNVYDDNVLLCAPIEEAVTGELSDGAKWDRLAPHGGHGVFQEMKAGGFVPRDARSFVDEMNARRGLPGYFNEDEWAQANDEVAGKKVSIAHRHERMMLAMDLMALAIADLTEKVEAIIDR